jgi:hypothetical protein
VVIDVQRVDAIAPEKSGKFRYVVSHVATGPSRGAQAEEHAHA